ncbi:MAG: DHH family phosphoesterase [Candidatus Thermoplasmatota archaeon]|nr:DHH family phosphoesterase [Candidatus Thermoplasmatota archaeon]
MDNPLKWMKVPQPLVERLGDAAALIESTSGSIRVISHYDGDGISSAGIISKSLGRQGLRFHTTMTNVMKEEDLSGLDVGFELLIVSDMGSSQAEMISKKVLALGARAIILDHHNIDGRRNPYSISDGGGVVEINPRFHKIDGTSGCSGSTLAFLLAVTLSPENMDLCTFSLAGSLADRQHVPSFTELNYSIRNLAVENGYLTSTKGMPFSGRSISEALVTSNDPFIEGISGDEDAVRALLSQMSINPFIPIEEVESEKMKVLQSYIYVRLLRNGVKRSVVHELFRENFHSKEYGSLQDLAYAIDGCGRFGKQSLGFQVVWGDMEAYGRALDDRFEYKKRIQELLLERKKEGVNDMEHIQWFEMEEETLSGTIAGLGHNYIFDHDRPMIAMAQGENGIMKVSSRGDREICKKGLDLATVMREAGKKAGGGGGGHNVAAGAHFPRERMEEFLDTCDRLVGEQLGKKGG